MWFEWIHLVTTFWEIRMNPIFAKNDTYIFNGIKLAKRFVNVLFYLIPLTNGKWWRGKWRRKSSNRLRCELILLYLSLLSVGLVLLYFLFGWFDVCVHRELCYLATRYIWLDFIYIGFFLYIWLDFLLLLLLFCFSFTGNVSFVHSVFLDVSPKQNKSTIDFICKYLTAAV